MSLLNSWKSKNTRFGHYIHCTKYHLLYVFWCWQNVYKSWPVYTVNLLSTFILQKVMFHLLYHIKYHLSPFVKSKIYRNFIFDLLTKTKCIQNVTFYLLTKNDIKRLPFCKKQNAIKYGTFIRFHSFYWSNFIYPVWIYLFSGSHWTYMY